MKFSESKLSVKYVLLFYCAGLSALSVAGLKEPVLMLDREPTSDSPNIITLGCLNITGGQYINVAVFFLNGSILYDMTDPVPSDSSRIIPHVLPTSNNMIVFVLNKKAEGNFTCGRRIGSINFIKSAPVTIVSLPSRSVAFPLLPPTSLFFAKVGSIARLECPETPGALLGQYYGIWRDSNSSTTLLDVPKPTAPSISPSVPDPRYSIDRSTFSLVIEDVVLSDSSSTYQCELRVESPQMPQETYTFGRSINLELLAYEPPTITTAPISQVVSSALSPDVVSFTCEAVSFTPPIITWQHKGKNITSGLKYLIEEDVFSVSGGGQLGTRSILRVLSIDVLDSGHLACLADAAPSPATKRFQLPGDSSQAYLTILGVFDSLEVFVTTTEDVIFSLTYQNTFMVPVRLNLTYFEQDGENRSLSVVPRTRFTNTSQINYIAFNQQVPYDRFQVEVALLHESVVGPGRSTMLVYDKTSPTCEVSARFNVIIFSVMALVGVILLCAVFIVSVVVCHLHLKHKNKYEIMRQTSKDFQEHIDYVKEVLGDNPCPEERLEFIRLIKAYFQRLAPPNSMLIRSYSIPMNMGSSQGINTTQLRFHKHQATIEFVGSSSEIAHNPLYGNINPVAPDGACLELNARYSNVYVRGPSYPPVPEAACSPKKLESYIDRQTGGEDEVDAPLHLKTERPSQMHATPMLNKLKRPTENVLDSNDVMGYPLEELSGNVAANIGPVNVQTSHVDASTEKPKKSFRHCISCTDSIAKLDEEMKLAKETAEVLKIMCRCITDPNVRHFMDLK